MTSEPGTSLPSLHSRALEKEVNLRGIVFAVQGMGAWIGWRRSGRAGVDDRGACQVVSCAAADNERHLVRAAYATCSHHHHLEKLFRECRRR